LLNRGSNANRCQDRCHQPASSPQMHLARSDLQAAHMRYLRSAAMPRSSSQLGLVRFQEATAGDYLAYGPCLFATSRR